MPAKARISCLGCKVNQAESAWLEEHFATCPAQDDGLAIMLTCAVTANASRQSRQMARRLLKSHGQVIVSGCDTQINPQAYHDMGAHVLPRAHLSALLKQQSTWPLWRPGQPMPSPEQGQWVKGWRKPGTRHTRAQLKVQDGCDANCAYCIVPVTRGLPRSLPLAEAQQAFQQLAHSGAQEIVLSGIHLGRYQHGQHNLVDLLRALLQAHPVPRIRLSSIEANEITQELLQLMASDKRLCPHLHVPLQSGSNKLLRAMGRTYSGQEYAQRLTQAITAIPGLCLGADVLAGLPGEDEMAFNETYTLLQSLPIAYLHVFPYSPRPGTRAAGMPGRPDTATARRRALALRALGHDKWLDYLKKQINKELMVLTESKLLGRAENYCPVKLDPHSASNCLMRMRILGIEKTAQVYLHGEII